MSEHQLPEPEPEPLGASPLELIADQSDTAAEMDMLVFSIADSVIGLINREDGARKNTFLFQQEKTLTTPDGRRVSLHHYDFFGAKGSPAETLYDEEYKGRRFAGIDIMTSFEGQDGQQPRFITKTYKINADPTGKMLLKRQTYNKKRDVAVYHDVDEDTIAEIALLLQSLRGDE